jgi:hypothetical protein
MSLVATHLRNLGRDPSLLPFPTAYHSALRRSHCRCLKPGRYRSLRSFFTKMCRSFSACVRNNSSPILSVHQPDLVVIVLGPALGAARFYAAPFLVRRKVDTVDDSYGDTRMNTSRTPRRCNTGRCRRPRSRKSRAGLSDEADAGKICIDLRFKSIEDFEPEQVVRRVAPLRELLDLRTKLSDLVGTLQGNEK